MEFRDMPDKPKRGEKAKRRFFNRRRLLVWACIFALIFLNLFIISEFWLKPDLEKLFSTVTICYHLRIR